MPKQNHPDSIFVERALFQIDPGITLTHPANGLSILLDPNMPDKIMDLAAEQVAIIDKENRECAAQGMKSPYKLSGNDYLAECRRLADIAQAVIDEKHNLFDFLPYTKAGRLPKDQTIIIADSNCQEVENTGEYISAMTLQLRLSAVYTSTFDYLRANTSSNKYALILGLFPPAKKTPPVFDRDNNPSTPVTVRAKNLKDSEILPGSAYLCGKQEFLYLGRIVSTYNSSQWVEHVYLRLTNAVKSVLEQNQPKSVVDLYGILIKNLGGKFNPSFRATTRKFTALIEQYLDPDKIEQSDELIQLPTAGNGTPSYLLTKIPAGMTIWEGRLVPKT